MSANSPSLNIVPDTPDGTFNFYSGQVVKLSATLVADNIQPDEQLIFDGMSHTTSLIPYSYEGDDANALVIDDQSGQTSVTMAVAPDRKSATAHLYVLDYSIVPLSGSGNLGIKAHTLNSLAQFPLTPYTTSDIEAMVPAPSGWQLGPVHGEQITPSTANGNFLFCVFAVSKLSDQQPLRNMCVRLYCNVDGNNNVINNQRGLQMFHSLDSSAPLRIRQSDGNDGLTQDTHYVDLITDETGYAQVYICPAPDAENLGGQLEYKIGDRSGPALTFTVPDLSAEINPKLAAPMPDGGNPLDLDATPIPVVQCTIPQYDNAAHRDQIFLFSNGAYQYYQVLDSSARVGSFQYSKSGLSSVTYSDFRKNALQYVVITGAGLSYASSIYQYQCEGTLSSAQPETEGTLAVPSVAEELYQGNVVNCATITDGLTIQVPLSLSANPTLGQWATPGSPVVVSIYIDGYHMQMQEPNSAVRVSPLLLEVTQENLDAGYLNVWFPKFDFMGYASAPGDKAGTFKVQYQIYNEGSSEFKTSQVFSCYIDTVPPDGELRAYRLRNRQPCI